MDPVGLVAQRLHQIRGRLTHTLLATVPPFWPFAFMTTTDPIFQSTLVTEHTSSYIRYIYYTACYLTLDDSGFTECRFAIEDDDRTHFEITAHVYKERYVRPIGLGTIFIRALQRAGKLKSEWSWMV